MVSTKNVLLLSGAGIAAIWLLGRGGGNSLFGGSGGSTGFGDFGIGGGVASDSTLETATEESTGGSNPVQFSNGFSTPEPNTIPTPIIPSGDGTITIRGQNAITASSPVSFTSSGQQRYSRDVNSPDSIYNSRGSIQTFEQLNQRITANTKSSIARGLLTHPGSQTITTAGYQGYTPAVLRSVYGININPFSRSDPIDAGRNRYSPPPDADLVTITDSATRAATVPELQARGIGINPYSKSDIRDSKSNTNPSSDLIARAHDQRVRNTNSRTQTRTSTGYNPARDRAEGHENNIVVRTTPPTPPTPTDAETRERTRRSFINPFFNSRN